MKLLRVVQHKDVIDRPTAGTKTVYTYKVKSVVNAIEPRIGEVLSETMLRDYTNHPNWKVTIT